MQNLLRAYSNKTGMKEAVVIIQENPPEGEYKVVSFKNGKIRGTPMIRQIKDMIELLDSIHDASRSDLFLAPCSPSNIEKVVQMIHSTFKNAFIVSDTKEFRALFAGHNEILHSRPVVFLPWGMLPLLTEEKFMFDTLEYMWILWENFATCSDFPCNANTFVNEFLSCAYIIVLDANDTVVKGQFVRLDDKALCPLFLSRWYSENDCAVCFEKQIGRVHYCSTCFHALCPKCTRQCSSTCPVCVSGKLQPHRHAIGFGEAKKKN